MSTHLPLSPPPYSNGPTHYRPSPAQASVILQLLLASMPHALLACDRRKLMRLTTRETAPSCGAPVWGGKRGGGAVAQEICTLAAHPGVCNSPMG